MADLKTDAFSKFLKYFNSNGPCWATDKGLIGLEGICNVKEEYRSTLTELPVVFDKVDGSITLNNCTALKTLKGLPTAINGSLTISNCPSLTSLEYLPAQIVERLVLSDLKISSLNGVGTVDQLILKNLPKLRDLAGLPAKLLTLSLEDMPQTSLTLDSDIYLLNLQRMNIPLEKVHCHNATIIHLGLGKNILTPPSEWFVNFIKQPQIINYEVENHIVPWLEVARAYGKDKDVLKYLAGLEQCGIALVFEQDPPAEVVGLGM